MVRDRPLYQFGFQHTKIHEEDLNKKQSFSRRPVLSATTTTELHDLSPTGKYASHLFALWWCDSVGP
jgi:hypothetical protein